MVQAMGLYEKRVEAQEEEAQYCISVAAIITQLSSYQTRQAHLQCHKQDELVTINIQDSAYRLTDGFTTSANVLQTDHLINLSHQSFSF